MKELKKIYHWETTEDHWDVDVEPIDVENCWPEIWWIEDRNWYDWIAFYENRETKQRYSRCWLPIAGDEMCKYGKIYKVKMVKDGPGDYDYHWDILSSRPDERPEEKF